MSPQRRLGMAGAAVLLGLVTLELLAHTWEVPRPSTPARGASAEIMLHGSPWLLWELQPGQHVEHGRDVFVNSAGFRGPERGEKSRPRALALGDSSVYGFGVGDDEVFTSVLERTLDADFVNGAVPGYSSYQALNLLDSRGLALAPDILLVATLWSDNNFDSFTDKELLASYAGWEGSSAGMVRALLETSALFRWLDWTFRVEPQGARARKVGWQLGGSDTRTGSRRVQIGDYAANLDAFCERMLARDGGVVFVELANRDDLREGVPAGPKAWDPYREVMADTAARYGALHVQIPPVFRSSGRSVDALFMDQMHPTAVGHALMAEALAGALQTAGWPQAPLRVHAPTTPARPWSDPFEGKGGTQSTSRGPRH